MNRAYRFTAYCLLPTAYCLLPTAYCLLPTAFCLLPTMNRIDALFSRLRAENRRALMPFVTAGDPDLATTALLITELVNRGAHLVEVGIPYSDPVADGPGDHGELSSRASRDGVKVGTHLSNFAHSAPRDRHGSTRPRLYRWCRMRSSIALGWTVI